MTGESAEKCAAREFHEETCAVVTLNNTVNTNSDMENLLCNRKFTFKIVTVIDKDRYYVTYVKQVPFDANVCRQYATMLQKLQCVRTESRMGGVYNPTSDQELEMLKNHPAVVMDADGTHVTRVRKEYIEKQALQWISLPHIREAIVRGDMATPVQRMPNQCVILRDTFRWRMKHLLPHFEQACVRWGGATLLSKSPINPVSANVRTQYHNKHSKRPSGFGPAVGRGSRVNRRAPKERRGGNGVPKSHHLQRRPSKAPNGQEFQSLRFQIGQTAVLPRQHGAHGSKMQVGHRRHSHSWVLQNKGKSHPTLGKYAIKLGHICPADAQLVPNHQDPSDGGDSAASAGGNGPQSGRVHIHVNQ